MLRDLREDLARADPSDWKVIHRWRVRASLFFEEYFPAQLQTFKDVSSTPKWMRRGASPLFPTPEEKATARAETERVHRDQAKDRHGQILEFVDGLLWLIAASSDLPSRTPLTGFQLYDDLMAAMNENKLVGCELAPIICEAYPPVREVRTSEDYAFQNLEAVINAEEERIRQIGKGAGIPGWWQDYAIVAAAVARAVAVSTVRSPAAKEFVGNIVRDFMQQNGLELVMDAEHEDEFYDKACRTEVLLDDLIVLLKSAMTRRERAD